MRNKGFVMIETIVVITVLSLGLIMLYASYTLIIGRLSVRTNYDNIGYIYKAHLVHEFLSGPSPNIIAGTVANRHTQIGTCYFNSVMLPAGTYGTMRAPNGTICNRAFVSVANNTSLSTLMLAFNIEKIYFTTTNFETLSARSFLEGLDGSSIGYLRSLRNQPTPLPGAAAHGRRMIVKFVERDRANAKIVHFASIDFPS